jgi:hypothetical protein
MIPVTMHKARPTQRSCRASVFQVLILPLVFILSQAFVQWTMLRAPGVIFTWKEGRRARFGDKMVS